AALSMAIGVRGSTDRSGGSAPTQWISSDRGVRQYRIVRDGCFRAAVPLPAGGGPGDLRGVRGDAFARPATDGAPRAPAGPVHLTRINKVFMLDDHDLPGPSRLEWQGSVTIAPEGMPFELAIR